MQNDRKILLTVAQAAKTLAVCDFSVRRLIWAGTLRSVRIGRALRVRSDDLQQFIEEHTGTCGEAR